jgi:hypothetical protein
MYTYGIDTTFTTGLFPDVVTDSAVNITTTSADIVGSLLYLGGYPTVTVQFEYGLNISYGNSTTPKNETTVTGFWDSITGLVPNAMYHYRAVVNYAATDSSSPQYGEDKTFVASTSSSGIVAPINPQAWTPQSGAGTANTNKTIMPTQPANWFASASNIPNLPFYQTFDDAATVINPDNRDTDPHLTTWTLYLFAAMAVAMAAGFGTLLFTGSTMMGLISTVFFMGLGVSMTIISGWMVFIVIVAGLGLWYLARSV